MDKSAISDNKRIARNTMMLYIRMFLTIGVSLFTSRVILQTLGVEDYGIYNIVGSIVITFSIISNCLRSSTQRFVSYELGDGDKTTVNHVLSKSLDCHVILSFIIIGIAETIGLWVVMTQLNIPAGRVYAARWVYQISIITFITNFFTSPFLATIISYERMSFYAYMSILDVLLKLFVAYLIVISPIDKMIYYALLSLFVSLVSLMAALFYCIRKLGFQYTLCKDKLLLRKILSYSGWTMISGVSVVGTQQGNNILLNLFSGVTANAAFGIANQVSNAVYGFAGNFQSAFQPQIVKLYAMHDYNRLLPLIYRSSCFSLYLLLIITVPFFSGIDFILTLWLGSVPEYTATFCILTLIYFLFDAYQAPLWILIGARGQMKSYTIWSSSIHVLSIPISVLILYWGAPVYSVFIVRCAMNIISCIIRPLYINHIFDFFNLKTYISNVVIRPFMVVTITILLYVVIPKDVLLSYPILTISLSFITILLLIYGIGIAQNERKFIVQFIKSRMK